MEWGWRPTDLQHLRRQFVRAGSCTGAELAPATLKAHGHPRLLVRAAASPTTLTTAGKDALHRRLHVPQAGVAGT